MDAEQLLERFRALDRAVARRDAVERRLREHPGSAVALRTSLCACEQVLRARAGLYRCLIRQGWQPPGDVVRAMLDDELLLDEPCGPIEA